MDIAQPSLQQRPYLTGIGFSLAVHLLLIVLWQASRPAPIAHASPARELFLRLLPAPERIDTPAPALPAAAPARARRQPAPPAQPAASPPDEPAASTAPQLDTAASPAAPASSADLLQQAKAAAGGIDRALRRENPRRGIEAPILTSAMKLERGIARAAALAPNKWYQAPKTEEIIDPGGYGRRRYRVTTAIGTYCVTYETNHGPDGRDTMRDGIPPKRTSCDGDEQPATFQKWQ